MAEVEETPAAVAAGAAAGSEPDMSMFDLSLKKKKKKKKKKSESDRGERSSRSRRTAAEADGGAAEAVAPATATAEAAAGGAATAGEGEEVVATPVEAVVAAPVEASAADAGEEEAGEAPVEYSYDELLTRIAQQLQANNPELTEKKRYYMKPPQLMKIGTKKTLWVNFSEICNMMRRNPEHVFQFMMAELGTEGSIDGSQRLVIRGKFVPKYIESLLRKYIVEYVTCRMCRSPNTTLTRDSVSRLYFVHCQDCGSSRSVQAIRAGYHAQTRADRRALRK